MGLFERAFLLNGSTNWPQLELILKSWACSLKWAQVEVNLSICSGDISFRSYFLLMKKVENTINFGNLLLLNKSTNWPQLGLLLKSCVCSLKCAQVEVNSLIRLGDLSFRNYLLLMEKVENTINFGKLLLLNGSTNWPQLGLILKSCVCSLKWA